MQEINDFVVQFDKLLKSFFVDKVVLHNLDDNSIGYLQVSKIITVEGHKIVVLGFSGSNAYISPNCNQ